MRRLAAALVVVALTAAAAIAREALTAPQKLRIRATVSLLAAPSGLALDARSLWVSVAPEHVILRLNPQTGRRLAQLEPVRARRLAFGGGELAVGRGAVWIATPLRIRDEPDVSGWIGRIDSTTHRLSVDMVGGDRPLAIAAGPAGVWAVGNHTLRRIDPLSGRVVATTQFREHLADVAVGSRSVWVAEEHSGRLFEVDPRTRRVVGTVRVGVRRGETSLAAGRLLWVLTDTGATAVDPRSRRVVRRVRVRRPNALALSGRTLWLYANGGLYSVDGERAPVRRATFARRLFGLVTARGATLWISDGEASKLRRFGR